MTALVPLAVLTFWAVFAGPTGSARAQTADADPWWGRDKLLHFSASASLAIVGYAGTSMGTENRAARAAGGAALAVGAGAAKELWDLDGHGDASWRDLTWDLIGAATGVLVSLAVDWSIHRLFRPPLNAPAERVR